MGSLIYGKSSSNGDDTPILCDSTGALTMALSIIGGSQVSAISYSSLPAASAGNAGQIYQITDFGYPYAMVQSNGSAWVQLTKPRITLAAMIAAGAAAWNGWGFTLIDVPAGGFSDWYSNGSDFFPVGGSVVLAADDFVDVNNQQLGTLSTTSQAWAKIAGWSMDVPAGLFKGIGARLCCRASVARAPNINASGAFFGVTPFDLDGTTVLNTLSFATTNNAGTFDGVISRLNSTKVSGRMGSTAGTTNLPIQSTLTISSYNPLVTWDEATPQTLYACGKVTSTGGDTIYLRTIRVTLEKTP